MHLFQMLFGIVWEAFLLPFEIFGYELNMMEVMLVTGAMSTLVWAIRRMIGYD